jgi:hypothetical protein
LWFYDFRDACTFGYRQSTIWNVANRNILYLINLYTTFPAENSILLLFFMHRAILHWNRHVELSCYHAFFICSYFNVYSSSCASFYSVDLSLELMNTINSYEEGAGLQTDIKCLYLISAHNMRCLDMAKV